MRDLINNFSIDEHLRDYQLDNKLKIYNLWVDNQSVMLQMPTGTGKTRLFASIVKDIHNLGVKNKKVYKVLILAHRQELIKQISENIGYKYGIAHGKIMSKNREEDFYPTQVASVQTLTRRLDKWGNKKFDFIIIDEAHHALAPTYVKICKEFPDAKILGVTATPYRMSRASFRSMFDELIISDSISEFIKKGFLSEYEYYSIKPNSKIQKLIDNIDEFDFDGDYAEKALSKMFDKDKIRANLLKTYFKYADGKKGIIYTINKIHNEHVCKIFVDAGINAKAIDSETKSEDRIKIVNDFKNGKIQILCNVNIFSEGFDCPDVEFIQLARPTKSLAMNLQQVGRGFRIHEGKEKVIFLDNVGLFNRFGLPSANRKWLNHFEGKIEVEDENERLHILSENVNYIEIDIEEGNENLELIFSSGNDKVANFSSNDFDKIEDFDLYLYDSFLIDLNYITENQDIDLNFILGFQKSFDISQNEFLLSEFDAIIEEGSKLKKITHIKKIQHKGKSGIWDSKLRKVLLEPDYTEISFLDIFGHLLLENNNKKGIYNFSLGLLELEAKYDDIIQVENKPNYFIVKYNNLFGLISPQNKIYFEPTAHQIISFKNLFNIKKTHFWELYNSSLNQIDSFFIIVNSFSNFRIVEYDNVFGICKGNVIHFPFVISQYEIVNDEILIIDHSQNGICILDKNLSYLIEPNNYNQIEFIGDTFFKVSRFNKSGIINFDGKTLIPVKFHHCEMIDKSFFLVLDERWSIIDLNGNIIKTSNKKNDVLEFARKYFLKSDTHDNSEFKVKTTFLDNEQLFNQKIYEECIRNYDIKKKDIYLIKVLKKLNINLNTAVELLEIFDDFNAFKNPIKYKISEAEYNYIKKISEKN
jgi:superfamily II DNA or RNA helicase